MRDDLEFRLRREIFDPAFTLGRLSLDDAHFGYTCEDVDRRLENGYGKIEGLTAIPRGRYELTTSMSRRFGKVMPEIVGVPGFSGVRIHGGNTAVDTEGCPLLGAVRTPNGVKDCKVVNEYLLKVLLWPRKGGAKAWITIE